MGPFVLRDDNATYFRQYGAENLTCFSAGVDAANPVVSAAERSRDSLFNDLALWISDSLMKMSNQSKLTGALRRFEIEDL